MSFSPKTSSQHYAIALDTQLSIAKSEQENNGEKVLILPLPLFLWEKFRIQTLKKSKVNKKFRACVKIYNINSYIRINNTYKCLKFGAWLTKSFFFFFTFLTLGTVNIVRKT